MTEEIEPVILCNVIVDKGETPEGSKECGKPAIARFAIADPDDPTYVTVKDVVFICQEHSDRMDFGEAFMFRSISGKINVIQFPPPSEEPIN